MATIESLIAWLPRRYRYTSPQQWDVEYASGRWDHLRSMGELARYSVIAGYCRHHKPEAAVFDVGCGEGILELMLRPAYSRYLGVDISETAIERARAAASRTGLASFACADALTFHTADPFDIVVFNECLYYFPEPLAALHRYENYLSADGLFVVSNVIRRRSRSARAQVRSAYVMLEFTRLRNAAGTRWEVAVLDATDRTHRAH